MGSCERWRQKADFSAHTLIKHSCLQCLHNACVHWTRPYSKVSSLSHRSLAASGSGSSLAKLQGVFFTGPLLWGGYLGPFKMLMTLIFRSSGVLLSELRSSWVRGGRAVMKTKQNKKKTDPVLLFLLFISLNKRGQGCIQAICALASRV